MQHTPTGSSPASATRGRCPGSTAQLHLTDPLRLLPAGRTIVHTTHAGTQC
ncbi:MAG: hypothetical protein U1F11_09630 [Steroidobacteraceae bacterium]